jgi:hypothetical protein
VDVHDERGVLQRLPVSLILLVSMVAAGVVYPVTDSTLHHPRRSSSLVASR